MIFAMHLAAIAVCAALCLCDSCFLIVFFHCVWSPLYVLAVLDMKESMRQGVGQHEKFFKQVRILSNALVLFLRSIFLSISFVAEFMLFVCIVQFHS
jgi:hypothetical protein